MNRNSGLWVRALALTTTKPEANGASAPGDRARFDSPQLLEKSLEIEQDVGDVIGGIDAQKVSHFVVVHWLVPKNRDCGLLELREHLFQVGVVEHLAGHEPPAI